MKSFLIKIIFLLSVFSFLFIFNCDMYKTYSKEEFMKIGQSDDKKDSTEPAVTEVEIDRNFYVKQDETKISIYNNDEFDFDYVESTLRDGYLNFIITIDKDTDIKFNGTPKIIISGDNASDFEIIEMPQTAIYGPNEALFKIKFVSTSTSGNICRATITIPNDYNTNFIFNIRCTAKVKNTYRFTNVGLNEWMPPYFGKADIILVGGGGSGGPGSRSSDLYGGGGGGAGQNLTINKIIINNDYYYINVGSGGSDSDGMSSSIYSYDINFIALGGKAGLNYTGGFGYPSGSNGEEGSTTGMGDDEREHIGDGGNGGNNGRGSGAGGNNNGDEGENAPSNSGGGGGGSASTSVGSNGGSGYCEIILTGFLNP